MSGECECFNIIVSAMVTLTRTRHYIDLRNLCVFGDLVCACVLRGYCFGVCVLGVFVDFVLLRGLYRLRGFVVVNMRLGCCLCVSRFVRLRGLRVVGFVHLCVLRVAGLVRLRVLRVACFFCRFYVFALQGLSLILFLSSSDQHDNCTEHRRREHCAP